jgi:hypothetical protein
MIALRLEARHHAFDDARRGELPDILRDDGDGARALIAQPLRDIVRLIAALFYDLKNLLPRCFAYLGLSVENVGYRGRGNVAFLCNFL